MDRRGRSPAASGTGGRGCRAGRFGWSRKRSPRKSASSNPWAWSIVPIAPSRTTIRSRRRSGRRARRAVRLNGGCGGRGRHERDGRSCQSPPRPRPAGGAARIRRTSSAHCSYRPKLGMMYVPATSASTAREQVDRPSRCHLRAALAGRAHRRPRLVGDRDPGHLVVEELGVARRDERQDAEQHRHREPGLARSGGGPPRASPRPARPNRAAGS